MTSAMTAESFTYILYALSAQFVLLVLLVLLLFDDIKSYLIKKSQNAKTPGINQIIPIIIHSTLLYQCL